MFYVGKDRSRLVKEMYVKGKRGNQKSNLLNLMERNTKAGSSERDTGGRYK